MTDWGASNRVDSFEFILCDPFTLAELKPVEVSASESALSWDKDSDNIYSGSIAALEPLSKDRLVRVRHTVNADGETITETLATMFVHTATNKALFGREIHTARCYSTLFRLTQDRLASDFSRPKGGNVVDAIRQLVEEVGGKLLVSDQDNRFSNRTFGRSIWFELGENRFDVVRTIASWIGCEISCDPDGNVTLSEAVDPVDKPIVYTFEAGRNCVYLPGANVEDNRADTVNRVVAYCTDESGTERAVVELGEESAFGYARCGRYQTAVLRFTEPMTDEELRSKAKAYLRDNSGERRFYTIEHLSIPGLKVGDVVDYENNTDFAEPVKARCIVAQMNMRSITPGAKCTTKLKTI